MAADKSEDISSDEKPYGKRSNLLFFILVVAAVILAFMFMTLYKGRVDLALSDEDELSYEDLSGLEKNEARRNTQSEGLIGYLSNSGYISQPLTSFSEDDPVSSELSVYEQYQQYEDSNDKFSLSDYFTKTEINKRERLDDLALQALSDDIGTNVVDAGMYFDSEINIEQEYSSSLSTSTNRIFAESIEERARGLQARIESVRAQTTDPEQLALINSALPTQQEAVGVGSTSLTGTGYDDDGQNPLGLLVPAATVIDGVLNQSISTDVPGSCVGIVRHNIYDIGRLYILIPQGSKLTCRVEQFNGANQAIQNRVEIAVTGIIRPDGSLIKLNDLTALEIDGSSGIEGEINRHLFAQTIGTLAYALVGLGPELSFDGDNENTGDRAQSDIYSNLQDQASPIASKYLSLIPTRTLKKGTAFKILLESPLMVQPYEILNRISFGAL